MVIKTFTRFAVFIFLLASVRLSAQDIHFSMFYASPLTLNPALTGANDGTYRAAGIYRSQWASISTPFTTYAVSFDIKLLQEKLKNDIFGVGGLFVGDKSGDGRLALNSGLVSVAYHKGLDKNHRHFLGLGVQLAYTQRSLKTADLSFPNQYNQVSGLFDQPNFDNISKPTLGYFDMNAGLLHQSTFNDVIGMMTGLSVFHLVQPKESFLGQNVILANRFTVTEGFHIRIIEHLYINPNFIFQYQNKATEYNLGANFEYHIPAKGSDLVASIGGWYRIKDAAIVTAGIEYYKIRGMFAYDINASNLKPATNGRGAFELAIIYTGIIKPKTLNYPILVPCPMM